MKTVPLNRKILVRMITEGRHESIMGSLVDSAAEREALVELERMTKRGYSISGIGPEYVKEAFAHAKDGRFNTARQGAWYCSCEPETSIEEVGFHGTRELSYTGLYQREAIYVEILADFTGNFPSLGKAPNHPALNPDTQAGYPEGQKLATGLRQDGYEGLLYPSVRRKGGQCFVAFEPHIVLNVKQGGRWKLKWNGTPDFSYEEA